MIAFTNEVYKFNLILFNLTQKFIYFINLI